MDAEQFSLKWNNFHSNLSSGFHALLRGEDLVDVTFAVDGKFLQAHKLVLSVCSPYFKQMFKIQPEKHPIIILKGVTYKELSDILSFMYRGEVNVRQEDLSNFLKTAELLQVKGLTDNDNDTAESNNTMQEEIKVAHAQQTPMHLKHEETMKQPVYKMDYALDPLAQNTPVSTSSAPKRSAHRLNPVSHNKKTRKEEPPMVEEVRVEELLNVNHTQTPKTEPVCIEDEDFDSSSNMADGLHMLDPKDMMAPCLLPMGSSLVPDGTLTDQEPVHGMSTTAFSNLSPLPSVSGCWGDHPNNFSNADNLTETSELVKLHWASNISIEKNSFQYLDRTRPSKYTGDLMMLVFGEETMLRSNMTGMNGKLVLDKTAVTDIIIHVQEVFSSRHITEGEVRKYIRKKLKNMQFIPKYN